MSLLYHITAINADTGAVFRNDGPLVSGKDSKRELFADLQKKYGRCVSHMYSGNERVGWVFEKRAEYSDCNDTYMQETWISVLSETEDGYNYANIKHI